MSDTLRQRVSRVIAGGAHALLDKIEDGCCCCSSSRRFLSLFDRRPPLLEMVLLPPLLETVVYIG